jgi:hypothetical protein
MKKLTTEEFIKRAREVHGDKYDYSKVEYVNAHTKVCIVCSEHGEFWQVPYAHIDQRQGCPKCVKRYEKSRDIVNELKKIHKNKYDYSKATYDGPRNKIIIICPKHGEFTQRFDAHLSGQGCPFCKKEFLKELRTSNNKEFLEKAREVHGDKYDYSKVDYVNAHTYVTIICCEHGEYRQLPMNHLKGKGCPSCKSSKLEILMRECLTNNNISFEEQKTFHWLKYKKPMKIDFYLPDYNIAIECQGGQHFQPVDYAGLGKQWAEKQLLLNQSRDKKKKELCEENGVKLCYINYDDDIEEKLLEIL